MQKVNRSLENLNYISEFHKDREIIGHAKDREKLLFYYHWIFIIFLVLPLTITTVKSTNKARDQD